MKERLTFQITERLPEGQAILTLYAWPDDFGGVTYCYEHDQLNLGCSSFVEAIGIARGYWEREKVNLIEGEFIPELTPEERAEIPF